MRSAARILTAMLALTGAAQAGSIMDKTWYPNGVVKYFIGSAFSATQRTFIDAALAQFDLHTPLRVFPTTWGNRNLKIAKYPVPIDCTNRTYQYRAHNKPDNHKQIEFSLLNNCFAADDIPHEFGHAIGMPHEFQRTDRNTFVDVNSPLANDAFNGHIAHDSLITGPFDFSSMMSGRGTSYPGAVPRTGFPDFDMARYYDNVGGGIHDIEVGPGDVGTIYRAYARRLEDPAANDRFGRGVATGDFDADGIEDLVVISTEDAPGSAYAVWMTAYKGVQTTEALNSGAAPSRIFDRNWADAGASPLAPVYTPWFRRYLGETGDSERTISVTTGDFNADKIDEIVVGNPSANQNLGEVYVIRVNDRSVISVGGITAYWGPFGRSDNLVIRTITPADLNILDTFRPRLGESLATGRLTDVGNFDAALDPDPVDADDLIIGAPRDGAGQAPYWFLSDQRGSVFHITGRSIAGALNFQRILNPDAEANAEFGTAVSVLPRYNILSLPRGAERFGAIVAGAPGANTDTGRIYVLGVARDSGGSLINPLTRATIQGLHQGRTGSAVVAFTTWESGDEFWVVSGAPMASSGGVQCGRAQVHEVLQTGVAHRRIIHSPQSPAANDTFGSSLAIYQEFPNLSGRDETFLAVGNPTGSGSGTVTILNPINANARRDLAARTPTTNMKFGQSLAAVRNGADGGGFVAGAPRATISEPGEPTVRAGSVDLILNRTPAPSWNSWFTVVDGYTEGDRLPQN